MVEPYLNRIGGVVDDDVALFTGGLNTYTDKAFLDSNQMPYVMNMSMYQPPMMCTRPARLSLAAYQSDKTPPYNYGFDVLEMFSPNENDIFVVTKNGDDSALLSRLSREDNASDYEMTVIASIPLCDNYYFTYAILQTKRLVYVGNEEFKISVDLLANPLTDGVTTYADHFGILCWHKQRLWVARPSDNVVEWSNILDPDTFTPGSPGYGGDTYITTRSGCIKNIVSFDDKLIVLCEHSIHAIYGSSGDATNANYFEVVDLNNNLGTHSARCVAVGGGRLFWLGDDYEVYEYTGASINIVSRPGKTRNSTLSIGGISNIFSAEQDVDYKHVAEMTATSTKLFLNIGTGGANQFLFVFDMFNRVWWCEDGEFTSITNYSSNLNRILMARKRGDICVNYERWNYDGVDTYYDRGIGQLIDVPIEYEFHTRVYGADGVDSRKTLSDVWFQARANADVYFNDIWTSHDKWQETLGETELGREIDVNYRKIGRLHYEQQSIEKQSPEEIYRPDKYEQQVCYTPKMYGERVNAFQIIVKGTGASKFYLMKREWRAR